MKIIEQNFQKNTQLKIFATQGQSNDLDYDRKNIKQTDKLYLLKFKTSIFDEHHKEMEMQAAN